MSNVRKTLGSLFRTQAKEEENQASDVTETEETTEETETAEASEEEESTSETSADETTTEAEATGDSVTMSLAAYNQLKTEADAAAGLRKQVANLTAKAKKWDAHQAAVSGAKADGDLNSTSEAEANETAAEAENKRLKARYGKLIEE
ncbi:MAG: hypothetical protein U0X91_20775 [Spirosomataceae bacterium]